MPPKTPDRRADLTAQINQLALEVRELERTDSQKANDIKTRIELVAMLEELYAKERSQNYLRGLAPVAVPLIVALLAFTAATVTSIIQTVTQRSAPEDQFIRQVFETRADHVIAARHLMLLDSADVIDLERDQKKYLRAIASRRAQAAVGSAPQ